MGFDLQTLELTDIERAQKQNVRLAESLDMGSTQTSPLLAQSASRTRESRT
jgi:hypothetical protein